MKTGEWQLDLAMKIQLKSNSLSYIPYTRHYNPQFAYFFTPFFSAREVDITDHLSTKMRKVGPKICGL